MNLIDIESPLFCTVETAVTVADPGFAMGTMASLNRGLGADLAKLEIAPFDPLNPKTPS